MDSQRKRPTLQRLSAVCPMNDNQDGPAEPRIPRLELDDGPDERLARPLRSGRPRAVARRELSAVLATDQRLMKREERRGPEADSNLSDAAWTQKERRESAQDTVDRGQVGRTLPWPAQDDQLLFD